VNTKQCRDEEKVQEPVGRVLSIQGSEVRIGLFFSILPTTANEDNATATVGKFLGIRRGQSLLVGIISEVSIEVPLPVREDGYSAAASVDLMGEITTDDSGDTHFHRGVIHYPGIGDPAALIGKRELAMIYEVDGPNAIEVGYLQQDATIAARINVNEMMNKHFAILGSTGVGKSSGVALIVQRILLARSDLRIFLLDTHSEYGHCFGASALIVNIANLKLPFWLFNFDELLEVIYGGRPGNDEEVEILAELIPLAKGIYYQSREQPIARRTDPKSTGYTIDTPVPYRLQDLFALLDEQMGKLENRSSRMNYRRLMTRIETVSNDPRYAFMFANANIGGDTMADTLRHLFRWQPDGKPMTVMQLAGFPSEIVDAVVSVLCRMAFDFGLWSDGAIELLFVCEEAHRYVSADRSMGFQPTRRALSRIAKEGRAHGIFLGLVTQRPAELDATIVSQCSTLFAMRMGNERDQQLIQAAVSDVGANLLRLLPSLGTREVLAFGTGVALPTRFTFPRLAEHLIPRIEATSGRRLQAGLDDQLIDLVIERWRGAMTNKPSLEKAS
jgi:DNA helicase HerA-like ATPase